MDKKGQNERKKRKHEQKKTPVGARFSAPVQTGLGAHPASCTMGTGSLFRGLSGRGVALTTHHRLAPRLKKEYIPVVLL